MAKTPILNEINQLVVKLTILTEEIRKNEHLVVNVKKASKKQLKFLEELLTAYKAISKDTISALEEYFKEERAKGNVIDIHYRLLEKKLKS